MNQVVIRLVNLGLRGSTLVSKFLLIFFLARFLEPSELGLYGLLAASVAYGLYLLGLDFYIFTTREILSTDRSVWGRLLKSQLSLVAILYSVFLPLISLLFVTELLPWRLFPWFLALIVLEHVAQELNRLLVALSRQVIASWVLFFRSGLWGLFVVAAMYLDSSIRYLETVFLGWIVSATFGVILGVFVIARIRPGGWQDTVDWYWVRRGLKVAIPMLIATLALRGLYTIDRYWFEALAGLDVLGAYVLFIGICNALVSFMDAAVFAFLYPSLISAFADQNSGEFRQKFHQLALQTVVLVCLFSLVAWALIEPLLQWLNKPLYSEHQYLFGWLLLANSIFLLSMVPHYGLYARGNDRPIITGHLLGFIAFLIATAIFSQVWPVFAVPYGLVTAFSLILVWKFVHFVRLTPRAWWWVPV